MGKCCVLQCSECGKWVTNKFILGYAHFCLTPEQKICEEMVSQQLLYMKNKEILESHGLNYEMYQIFGPYWKNELHYGK